MSHAPETIECARLVAGKMCDLAHQYCVPIIAAQLGRKPQQCGTGTLFQVADHHFLVAASHIVQDALAGNAILLSTCAAQSEFFPLPSAPYYTDKNASRWGDESGPYDIAIWRLEKEQIEAFSKLKRFANNSVVDYLSDLSHISRHELFYLCGFPTEFAKYDPDNDHNLIVEPTRWIAGQQLDRSVWPDKCESKYHIVLNSKTAIPLNSDGEVITPPKVPQGISGCAVWSLGWDPVKDSWNPDKARIVAIETRVFSGPGLIRATGWVGVRSILMREFPELEKSFYLHLRT